MPEGHAISVKRCHAVIAPPCRGLRRGAIDQHGFTLAEIVWRIGFKTPRVTNSGVDGGAGRSITDCGISVLINGYARHKAPQSVTAIGPLLLLRSGCWERAAGDIELIPTNSSRPAREIEDCGLVGPQRFRPVAVLINHRCHDFVAKGIHLCCRSTLWHQGERVVQRSI